MGRDAENDEEFQYAYNVLLKLCEKKSQHVRAYSLLGMSLLANVGILDKWVIVPVIMREIKNADVWSRDKIITAIDDFNYKLNWKIEICLIKADLNVN